MDFSDLKKWHQAGLISATDLYFAGFLAELDGGGDPLLPFSAALVSRHKADGHVCLDLRSLSEKNQHNTAYHAIIETLPPEPEWSERLRQCTVIGQPGDYCPLVLDKHSRLYFYRYWLYEKRLADALNHRSICDEPGEGYDPDLLRSGLDRHFPATGNGEGIDWQKIAATVAVMKRICVISGGPGTGKTHTVAKILALLLEQPWPATLRTKLAAPTGKAASKLGESLRMAGTTLDCSPEVRAAIPQEAVTIHRLLQTRPGNRGFGYNEENRLPVDIMIVDEASMIDLALMSHLIQALPDRARLILLGDRDQLASVEAGSVLGDICDRSNVHPLSSRFREKIEDATGQKIKNGVQKTGFRSCLRDNIVQLVKSYRFDAKGGIGALSSAVNAGNADAAVQILRSATDSHVRWIPVGSAENLYHRLMDTVLQGYRAYLRIEQPMKALETFGRFRILCAVRKGPYGVESVNRYSEQILKEHSLIRPPFPGTGGWYHGRPVMITQNDYQLGLYNGDIGLALNDSVSAVNQRVSDTGTAGMPAAGPMQAHLPEVGMRPPYDQAGGQGIRVIFNDADGNRRSFPAYRIGSCETVYAMTVHKSQGSEFDEVHILLPDTDSPVVSRELIYTAITRARHRVCIWGAEQVLRSAIGRRIQRTSGLRDALWSQDT